MYQKDAIVLHCKFCPTKFARPKQLHRHILSVHNSEFEWKCEECQRYFLNAEDLRQHEKVVHHDQFDCVPCEAEKSLNESQPKLVTA